MTKSPQIWRNEMEAELKNNILSFWMKHTLDDKYGGFVGEIDNQMNINPEAGKSLVLNARILWTFASAYRMYGNAEYLTMAERAHAYLLQYFTDAEYGGYYWMVDALGAPSERKNKFTARPSPSTPWLSSIMLLDARMHSIRLWHCSVWSSNTAMIRLIKVISKPSLSSGR